MIKTLNKIYFMVFNDVSSLITLIFFFLSLSFLDLLGLGIIVNFITIIVDQKSNNLIFFDFTKFFFNNLELEYNLIVYGFSIIFVFILKNTLSIYFNYYVINFSLDISKKYRISMIKKIFLIPLATVNKLSNAEVIKIFGENIANFESAIQSFLKLLSDTVVLLAIIIFLGFIEIKSLSFILFIIVFFSYLFNYFYLSKLKMMGKSINKNLENIFKNISYALNGYKEFKILSKISFIQNSFINSTQEIKKYRLKQRIISILPRHLLEIIIISFICLYVILFQLFNSDLNKIIPIISAFGIAAIRLIPIFNQVISSINVIKFSSNSINNIENFLSYKNADYFQKEDHLNLDEIKFENVSFFYENNKKILNNIDIQIKKGDFIGIVGKSGSGKSTFLNLLIGFIKPKSGIITINQSKNLTLLNNFSNLIAYIPQDITLLNDTILKNIALEDKVSEQKKNEIIEICLKLGLIEEYTNPDNFLFKKLEEFGSNLSGGQRQRIAIARAMIHKRKILILDEVTSSLDKLTGDKFIDLLNNIKSGLTIIIVSHKPNSLRNCDRIYKVDKGVLENHQFKNTIISQ